MIYLLYMIWVVLFIFYGWWLVMFYSVSRRMHQGSHSFLFGCWSLVVGILLVPVYFLGRHFVNVQSAGVTLWIVSMVSFLVGVAIGAYNDRRE